MEVLLFALFFIVSLIFFIAGKDDFGRKENKLKSDKKEDITSQPQEEEKAQLKEEEKAQPKEEEQAQPKEDVKKEEGLESQ